MNPSSIGRISQKIRGRSKRRSNWRISWKTTNSTNGSIGPHSQNIYPMFTTQVSRNTTPILRVKRTPTPKPKMAKSKTTKTNRRGKEESTPSTVTVMKTRPRCQYPGCWHKSSMYGCCKSHVDEGMAAEALLELKYGRKPETVKEWKNRVLSAILGF